MERWVIRGIPRSIQERPRDEDWSWFSCWLCSRLQAYCRTLVCRPSLFPKVDAEDLTQETIISGFRRIGGFVGETEADFWLWLKPIVLQTLLNLHRIERSSQPPLGGNVLFSGMTVEEIEEPESRYPLPEEVVEREEILSRIDEAIGCLTPSQAKLLRRYFFEGATIQELAMTRNVSPSTIRKRLNVCVARLKFHLPKDFREYFP